MAKHPLTIFKMPHYVNKHDSGVGIGVNGDQCSIEKVKFIYMDALIGTLDGFGDRVTSKRCRVLSLNKDILGSIDEKSSTIRYFEMCFPT